MSRKKPKMNNTNTNEEWQRPFTLSEDLKGSVSNLEEILKTLRSSVGLINSVTTEFNRQGEATRHIRQYELVTYTDISYARVELSQDAAPAIQQGSYDYEQLLDSWGDDEGELGKRLELQEKRKGQVVERKTSKVTTARPLKRKRKLLKNTRTAKTKINQKKQRRERIAKLIKVEKQELAQDNQDYNQVKTTSSQVAIQMENDLAKSQPEPGAPKPVVGEQINGLTKETTELNKLESTRKKALEKKKQMLLEQTSTGPEIPESSTTFVNKESTLQYIDNLETIQNTITQIQETEVVASATIINSLETRFKRYIQSLQTEKLYIQDEDLPKQESNAIQHLITVCKMLLPDNNLGKTAGRILELILTNEDKISIGQLLEEFPSTMEKRHNLTKVTRILIDANIVNIGGTDLIINKDS